MLKPFYIKKKNIDNRLVPEVSAADAGKVLGVTEEGKIAAVEGGGGAAPIVYDNLIKLSTSGIPDFFIHIFSTIKLTAGSISNANFKTFLIDSGYPNNSTVFVGAVNLYESSVGMYVYYLQDFINDGFFNYTLKFVEVGKSDLAYNQYKLSTAYYPSTITVISSRTVG